MLPGLSGERLFARRRANKATPVLVLTALDAGAGLGLAITRTTVGAHGGTITAESQLAQGSTFTVALPAA
jgi:signal transduction histidine kinase